MSANDHRRAFLRILQALPRHLPGLPVRDESTLRQIESQPSVCIEVRHGEHHFHLVHDLEESLSSALTLEILLGPLEPRGEAATLAKMLDMNFRSSSRASAGFAIDVDSGDILHACTIPFEGTSPDNLASLIANRLDSRIALRDTVQQASHSPLVLDHCRR